MHGICSAFGGTKRRGGQEMSWRYSAPQRCDFDSEEDYNEAMSYYDNALDMYAEEYFERTRNY